MDIGDILMALIVVWLICTIIAVVIYGFTEDDDDDVDFSIIALFPANLILVIKYWWKSIIKAIKS